jgi:hypothetical protein
MLLYTRNLIPKIPARILKKHCQITFLRTFGSRRPPTVTITLTCNITDPARRREEGMSRDGGEDDGGAGGSPGRSAEDGGNVPIHAEPWRHTGFRSATSIVPYN